MKVYNAIVVPTLVYGSETRLLSKQQESAIQATGVSYTGNRSQLYRQQESAIQATKNDGAKKNSREEKGGQGEKCGD